MFDIIQNEMYVGFSNSNKIRENSSSGGVVTGLLTYMLNEKIIDCAIVSRIISINNNIRGISEIVTTNNNLLDFAGSSYIDTPVLSAVKKINEYNGKVAIVALPCQIRAIRQFLSKNNRIAEQVIMIIGLFCRGNITCRFYNDYFEKAKIRTDNIDKLKIKRGYLQGTIFINRSDGRNEEMDFNKLNYYRIAGIHGKTSCLFCDEHLAMQSDISVGDIFTPEFKNQTIKHSAIIPRSNAAVEVLKSIANKEQMVIKYYGIDNYLKCFHKIEKFGKNLRNRRIAAKFAGIKNNIIENEFKEQSINPFHILSWTLFYLNYRLSKTKSGRIFLFKMPMLYIKANALLIKGLSHL